MLNLIAEKELFKQGYKFVAGIDEAGRGPLAGPVVAACVVCDEKFKISDKIKSIKDSKKLTAKKRDELFTVIQEEFTQHQKKVFDKVGGANRSVLVGGLMSSTSDTFGAGFTEVGVGICDHQTIDRINILQASFLAMKKAISALKQKPDFIMLDGGFKIPNCSYAQRNIIKGDALIFSIATASIIAKVTRDRIMLEAHKIYPNYGFDKHKGYGTKMHLERLRKYGPCPIHRTSFKPVKLAS
ncbi:MAG: ribonuclease HII [Patescibacteria group bacterium]|nr:ribonuclease HII [Patescibacteria group bacterium]MBU1160360.1 ribonuclease HII [Patescibacteria group bacterium]MBU1349586.1 ribonuclease HII [Patescibacteria group bacterium]MBU1420986.1 ribonuclease HII [Patescibacteria group bacterium]MBU1684045.1 ribonuclease HII [Patescibacteria group bacterium]